MVGTISTSVMIVVITASRRDSPIAEKNPDCLKMSGNAFTPANRSAA